MPARPYMIAVCAAVVILLTSPVAARQTEPGRPQPTDAAVKPVSLPKTFSTPGNVKATVVSSSPRRLTVDATAASGVSSTITIVGPPTIMEKDMIGTLIDLGIGLLEKWIGGGGGGGKGGKCTQTITSTTTGGSSTTTIKTECTTQQ